MLSRLLLSAIAVVSFSSTYVTSQTCANGSPAPTCPTCTTTQTGSSCINIGQGSNARAYGDAPQYPLTPSSPYYAESLSSVIQQQQDVCQGVVDLSRAQILNYTDHQGTPRTACLIVNNASTSESPLPMLVWLHPSLYSSDSTFASTGFEAYSLTQSINSETNVVGFHILLPEGRNTEHYYPAPDNVGLGWDNWYRNYDRGSTGAYTVNVDTETIDYFISKAKELTYVDNRRVHMGGWSNGAAMALQYAAMTPNIASAAVYSAPDNTADANDPCAQHMNPRYNTPTLDIHNYCDIIGICTTGLYYWQDLTCRYPDSAHNIIVIDDATQNIIGENNYASCDVTCQPGSNGGWTEGATAHMRWPTAQNTLFINFWASHALSTDSSGNIVQYPPPTNSIGEFTNKPRSS